MHFFEVGDHIRVVRPEMTHGDYGKGDTAVVTEVDGDMGLYVAWDKPKFNSPRDQARATYLFVREVESAQEDDHGPKHPDLVEKIEAYMVKWKAEGKPFHVYLTPCCNRSEETTAPSNDYEKWDSLCICPQCGEVYLKDVTHDTVNVRMPPKSGDWD